jgi:Cys-tRNA(Pro)/Cys-tRNA(Cys) deacylase
MTQAINVAKKAKITYQIHSYNHDSLCVSYGTEASEKLGIPADRVFKTLVVLIDSKAMVVAVIPVSSMLSMKQIAKAAGGKKAEMANGADVERSSGYILGGVSPLGQKKRLKTFIDSSAEKFTSIYVSAGRRGLEIELAPQDLLKLTNGVFSELTAGC